MINKRWILWLAGIGIFLNPVLGLAIVMLGDFFAVSVWPRALSMAIDVISETGFILISIALVLWAIYFWQKQSSRRYYILFLIFAIVGYLICDLGFGVYAQVKVRHLSIYQSLHENLYYAAIQPLGTIMMAAPFLFLGWISASFAQRYKLSIAILLFFATFAVLVYMYFSGHMASEMCLLEKKWTASALSTGLLPFQSGSILLIVFIVTRIFIQKKSVKDNNASSIQKTDVNVKRNS
jgi:hypothetical protein